MKKLIPGKPILDKVMGVRIENSMFLEAQRLGVPIADVCRRAVIDQIQIRLIREKRKRRKR